MLKSLIRSQQKKAMSEEYVQPSLANLRQQQLPLSHSPPRVVASKGSRGDLVITHQVFQADEVPTDA